jgi:5-methyltetrahydrofolate--homocysteine methyltransferase
MVTDSPEGRRSGLLAALDERILVIDGAWGTLLQREGLTEADFRGDRFSDWPRELRGNYDVLNLTRPDLIRSIHVRYLEAGADITSTNTFTSTRIAQADYGFDGHAAEMAREGARLAREAVEVATARDGRPRWVAGVLGPTNRAATLSPTVTDPAARSVTFDELRDAYRESAAALIEGGADLLLLETIFDTLNAKAAIVALEELFEELGDRWPVILSGTIADASGRNLTGQTVEAFWTSLRHARPLAVGLNCSPGPDGMRPHLAALAQVADTRVSAHPNAGLPNDLGEYDLGPEDFAAAIGAWARDGLLNIAGSCCGSTPEHTRAIADAVRAVPPRRVPGVEPVLRLAGLEMLMRTSVG